MVVGRISFYENGAFVDCNKLGIQGKNIVALPEQMTDIRLEVKFILVIEKDTTLQRCVLLPVVSVTICSSRRWVS